MLYIGAVEAQRYDSMVERLLHKVVITQHAEHLLRGIVDQNQQIAQKGVQWEENYVKYAMMSQYTK